MSQLIGLLMVRLFSSLATYLAMKSCRFTALYFFCHKNDKASKINPDATRTHDTQINTRFMRSDGILQMLRASLNKTVIRPEIPADKDATPSE